MLSGHFSAANVARTEFVFIAQKDAELREIRPSRDSPGPERFPGSGQSDFQSEGQDLLERVQR